MQTYCLFCHTGEEIRFAELLNRRYEGVRALPVLQEQHASVDGVRRLVKKVMLPGYLFLYTRERLPWREILREANAYRFLQDGEAGFLLSHDDRRFAEWVWKYQGLIECSQAVREGTRVRILAGPLKDYEGDIVRVEKKNRNGRVEIKLKDRVFQVWLAFDWVTPTV